MVITKNYLEKLKQVLQEEIEAFLSSQPVLADGNQPSLQAIDDFLENASVDIEYKLVRFAVLHHGTPQALSDFAQQGPQEDDLMQRLLLEPRSIPLATEMLLADGPQRTSDGVAHYGPAMKIYASILAESDKARASASMGGILHRLALAIALEHAVPMRQRNPDQSSDGEEDYDEFVDPVKRYLNYEMAYLDGALDPMFGTLTLWELRFVVNGDEPDEISAWGREMLTSYRPDHVLQEDYVWKYVAMVRSNIRYGSQDVKYDRSNLQQYQNILMNGGVCGRRAFFGRFILRAFGIPTTARPSPGHGALIHWTPQNYWVANLGGGIGCGTTKTIYKKDLDFLATAKARTNRQAFWKVKRAQWLGDACGETPIYGVHEKGFQNAQFWYGVSLKVQESIVKMLPEQSQPPDYVVAPDEITTSIAQTVQATPVLPDANQIRYESSSGTIVIPAAAYIHPRKTKDANIMKCFRDGFQIYLPPFAPQGLTIMRGGTFKSDANGCRSGQRIKSGGYGKYHDWGFCVAISADENATTTNNALTIEIARHTSGVVAMDFIYVPPGTFLMGGVLDKDGRFECVEVPKHKVQLSRGYYLGKYPVTQAQYQAVMGNNPSKSTREPMCPVDNIGESDALDFCNKLVETIGKDFRLPTEAEWEYACRAEQGDTSWFFGNDPSLLGDYAWYQDNSGGKSHPVGQKRPNPFGLYDIYGNVFERVADKYDKDYYKKSPLVDPKGPSQGTKSVCEYKIQVAKAGEYTLNADVITANEKQCLNVSVNGSATSQVFQLPFTKGLWQETSASSSTVLSLKRGENLLRFWRDNPPQYGIAIKRFILQPV